MKKIISLILAAVMLLALGTVAFAGDMDEEPIRKVEISLKKIWNDQKENHEPVDVDIFVDGKIVKTARLTQEKQWIETVEIDIEPVAPGEAESFIKNRVKAEERPAAGYEGTVHLWDIAIEDEKIAVRLLVVNDEIYRVEIPVTVTVKKTGNVAPGMHTFYYDFLMNYNKPEMSDLNGRDGAEAEDMPKYTVSYTGALKADGNGFSVMTKGEGTYSGTIVVEATQNVLGHLMGSASRRGSSAIPGGWTYDETVYGVIPGFESEEGGVILGTSYMLFKLEGQAPGAMVPIEGKTMAFVNEYKENRVTTGTDTIKIPAAPAKAEANPNTGAPAQIAYAAVIALGTAAVALKVRK